MCLVQGGHSEQNIREQKTHGDLITIQKNRGVYKSHFTSVKNIYLDQNKKFLILVYQTNYQEKIRQCQHFCQCIFLGK